MPSAVKLMRKAADKLENGNQNIKQRGFIMIIEKTAENNIVTLAPAGRLDTLTAAETEKEKIAYRHRLSTVE